MSRWKLLLVLSAVAGLTCSQTPSWGKCGPNTYCAYFYMDPTKTADYQIEIKNKKELAYWNMSYVTNTINCWYPSVSFKFQKIDNAKKDKHITVYDTLSPLADCFFPHNYCDKHYNCLDYKQTEKTHIRGKNGNLYTITVVQSEKINEKCNNLAINGVFTLHCPVKVKCGDTMKGTLQSGTETQYWLFYPKYDTSCVTIDGCGSYFGTELTLENAANGAVMSTECNDCITCDAGLPVQSLINQTLFQTYYLIALSSADNTGYGKYTVNINCDSKAPTHSPTKEPTHEPTHSPTKEPTPSPTPSPTKEPTDSPTGPTLQPTHSPTDEPTYPTVSPTHYPTQEPTSPTMEPSFYPTLEPTIAHAHSSSSSSNTGNLLLYSGLGLGGFVLCGIGFVICFQKKKKKNRQLQRHQNNVINANDIGSQPVDEQPFVVHQEPGAVGELSRDRSILQ